MGWNGQAVVDDEKPVVPGVGPDAPTVTNEAGGKQSKVQHRLDLLPAKATLEIGAVLDEGARKYGDDNWRKISQREHINHALIHFYAFLAGDRSDNHLAHAVCRGLFAMETE